MSRRRKRSATPTWAVLLIAHGSRRLRANLDLIEVAQALRARRVAPIVEVAYLEIARPDILHAAARCVARGAKAVRMLPWFLSAGAHVIEDLERHRRLLEARFPGRAFELCPPLGVHPLLVDIAVERVGQSLPRPKPPRRTKTRPHAVRPSPRNSKGR